jgi:hypothetical protein
LKKKILRSQTDDKTHKDFSKHQLSISDGILCVGPFRLNNEGIQFKAAKSEKLKKPIITNNSRGKKALLHM